GGFSRRNSPFIVGTMMWWSVTISRAVTRLRTSIRSGRMDVLPDTKIIIMITMTKAIVRLERLVAFVLVGIVGYII
ncbi:MAG: hypothetical protein ACI4TS_04510, partial [Bacteroidaceae bacterium]